MFKFILLSLIFYSCSSNSNAELEMDEIKLEPVVTNLTTPWALAFLPNGDHLITEKEGKILWHKKSDPPHKFIEVQGVPDVYDGGQGGLMDLVLHPDFKTTPWIYLTYSISKKSQKTTRVSRALWNDGALENFQVLFTAQPWFSRNLHFGSRLVFDSKGYMFFTVGDRGNRDLAQDLSTHNGKVMRLHADGSVPKDNPFMSHNHSMKEIWSYGHRNPQGLVFKGEELWAHEHGPRGGDEINLIQKGKNYGWPIITYGKEYIGGSIGEGFTKAGMEDPKKYYIPSIAPCGMAYYNGNLFPKWKNSFFIGSLVLRHLNRVSAKDFSEERLLNSLGKRIRDVRVGPDGFIYFSAEEDAVYRMTPK